MKLTAAGIGALLLTAAAASAGGIDRGRLTYGALFEPGRYLELGATHVSPSISGTYTEPLFGPYNGTSTGDMAKSYNNFSFAYKADISDQLSYGVFLNTPYGASSNYSNGAAFAATRDPYNGLTAEWESKQLTALLKFKVNPNISVYGGLKYVRSKANITIPDALIRGGLQRAAAAGSAQAAAILAASPAGSLAYSANGGSDGRAALILGAAYEKPEIALRVSLTYESGFTHKFGTTETIGSPALAGVFGALGNGTTRVKMPQSLTLDFQTGVAKDTLVFGSLRWSEWSNWEVRPQAYDAVFSNSITDFKRNVVNFQIGVGRKFSENFSGFVRVGYEKGNGLVASRLSPVDGNRSIGIGGTYTKDNMKITAGLEYVKLGDAVDGSGTRFSGNKAVGFGVTVGYRF